MITVGEHLHLDYMQPTGETIESLSKATGISGETLVGIIYHAKRMDKKTGAKLDKYYGHSKGFWMRVCARCIYK